MAAFSCAPALGAVSGAAAGRPRPALCLPSLDAPRWREMAPRGAVLCCSSKRTSQSKGAKGVPSPLDNGTTVFALDADVQVGKLEYIQDALETCSVTASPEQRKQCFETFGLDADKVDRYYAPVCSFERLINQDDNVGYQVVSSGGAGLLWLVALCLLKTP